MKRKNIASLIAIVAIIAVVAFAGCVEEETPVKSPETTPSTETVTPTQKTAAELNLKVGETANTSKIAVTVISAKKTNNYIYYSDIFKETMVQDVSPGDTFVLAEIEIKKHRK